MAANIFDQESQRFNLFAKEKTFIAKIRDYHRLVSVLHRESRVIDKVKNVVPWEKLSQIVSQKILALSDRKLPARELFLIELMDWYKNSFFSWYNKGICRNPVCPLNGVEMESAGSGQPTDEDLSWGAGRIEVYRCASCGTCERFPRYNHPLKLLETRTGRCGEWANLFTCICSVFGYEARLILDWTDHVWTEVYSESQDRWVHMDCCENGIDTPLVYEVGWGKKLTYCIGISPHEIQDVTWRYTQHHPREILARRNDCQESWLRNFILKMNESMQRDFPIDKKVFFKARFLKELIEYLWTPWKVKVLDMKELQGRQSGSEAWRLARNEMGKLSIDSRSAHVVEFTDQDLNNDQVTFSYNSIIDEYAVNGSRYKKGWMEGTFEYKNIQRKIEHDWKMVYLSRIDGSSPESIGSISWKFDLRQVNRWTRFSILISGQILEDAQVQIEVEGSSCDSVNPFFVKRSIPLNKETIMQRSDFPGCSSFVILAKISGLIGGNIAWQKGQLFRQSIVKDSTKDTFVVKIFC